ncbi:MAG: hemolysin family protein [Alistipes sp.]|jgi:putative hemolysin|nr:hemolysin family protein [Alistipes sp.]
MEIVIIIGLILLNGLLSMSEIALVSARKSKIELKAKKGSRQAATALKLMGQPDRFLSTIQIGITLIGIVTGLYSGEAFADELTTLIERVPILAPGAHAISKTVIVIAVTYLTLVFGELVPKRLGMNNAERLSMSVAEPMIFLARVAYPFVWLLAQSTTLVTKIFGMRESDESKVTEEEVKAIVKESLDDGEIEEIEHDIVERVFGLGDRDISSIMTHRTDLVFIDIDDDREISALRDKIVTDLHDTYPVVSGSVDNIIGVIQLKDLFGELRNNDFSLESIVRAPHYLPENMSVYDALIHFKSAHVKYGIIMDEFGAVQGIVTLTDIMEALVGEMPEDGEGENIVQRDDGSWLVDGQYSFYDFLSNFDAEYLFAENNYNTVSGLILELLGNIPKVGEKVVWNAFTFEVLDMDGARIDKLLVTIESKNDN